MSLTRIIVYHRICLEDPLRYNTLFVTQKTFEAHLNYYKEHYNIISLEEAYNELPVTGKLNLCISFDDGFENNFRYALPLLRDHAIPAVFFITAIRKAGYDVLWNDRPYVSDKNTDYWLQMNEAQIRELGNSPRVTIGSHGYYHNDLRLLTDEEAASELRESKTWLEEVTGKTISSVAFPYGSYSNRTLELARQEGYQMLLGADPSLEDDPAAGLKQRMIINPFISVKKQMKAIENGYYD